MIGLEEIGSAFLGSSALDAVSDSYLLLTRPSAHLSATVELRFQFRYAAPPEPRLLQLDPDTLCFSAAGLVPSRAAAARKKVEPEHVTKALAGLGQQGAVQPTPPAGHGANRMGHCRGLPARAHRAGRQSVSTSVLILATLHRVAPAQTLPPRGVGPEAGDGSVAQTCSSVLPSQDWNWLHTSH